LSDFDHKRPRYVRVGQKKASVEARAGTTSATATTGGDGIYSLTAGDLARLLGVDLKTIHNWVNQRHLFALRTEGRHLRFARVEVVRFLRRLGHDVPPALGRAAPLVLAPEPRRGSPRAMAATRPGLVDSVLELALGTYEVFVLGLDAHEPALTREVVAALRSRPETHALSLVGVSRKPARLTAFLAQGGDVALRSAAPKDVTAVARWLTGASTTLPRTASVPVDRAR
jgi:excisionase family DNA binding protein